MNSYNKPLVSVIILNWNSCPFVHDCIKSLKEQTFQNIEVIFVDNKSSDNSLIECKARYPELMFVENNENLGFAKGMNSGLKYVRGKYCLLLNTDVYLSPNYIEECVNLLESDNSISCTAGYEYKWNYPRITNCQVGTGVLGIALHMRVVDAKPKSQYVFGVSGSFPIYRTDTINEIIDMRGYFFDPLFETGWEDTELRFLFILLGKKTQLCTTTKAWHIGSAADNGNKGMFEKNLGYQKRIFRNRLYVIEKYIKGNYTLWSFYLIISNFIISAYVSLFHNKSLPALREAIHEFNMNRDNVTNQRFKIANMRRTYNRALYKYVVSI